MKLALKILAVFVLASIAYYAYWEFQYRRAAAGAKTFCEAVPVGSDISKVIVQAQALEGVQHGFQENRTRYIVIFRGPIFNQFVCELDVADGRVSSRHARAVDD